MFRTGFSGRLSGWGSAAKVAVATTAAALTLTAAVAAAVVLPAGGGDEAAAVLRSANLQAGPVDTGGPTTSAAPEVQVSAEASVPTPTGAASARADAGTGSGPAGATPSTPLRSIPSIPIPSIPDFGGALPDLSSLTDIPTKVMGCLAPIYDLVSSMPSIPSMEQVMQIGPTIVSCVTAIVADLPLPFGMNACIAEIMGFVSDMTSNLPTGVPAIGNLNVAACIPSGLPVPTGFSGLPGGGLPFRR
ncbi:MAG TPA: hypothetical protein VG455_14465 [Acidimicrobiales bacterium]|nr:hypothetical protein [Acidimicrobiales bacterium]